MVWNHFKLSAGTLAKFQHVGPPQALGKTSQYVAFSWLPHVNKVVTFVYGKLLFFVRWRFASTPLTTLLMIIE